MIYLIDDKYYVNISPNIYVEVELKLEKDDLILVPTNRQREVNKTYQIKQIYFEQEKDKIKKKLQEKLKAKMLKDTTPKEKPRKSFVGLKSNSTNNKRW